MPAGLGYGRDDYFADLGRECVEFLIRQPVQIFWTINGR